jgi:hypothetical protein
MSNRLPQFWLITAKVEAATPARAIRTMTDALYRSPEIISAAPHGATAGESPWRPIETAPTDGTPFIGFDANIGFAHTAKWSNEKRTWVDYMGDAALLTHWMPQPKP